MVARINVAQDGDTNFCLDKNGKLEVMYFFGFLRADQKTKKKVRSIFFFTHGISVLAMMELLFVSCFFFILFSCLFRD
jgi:hypothetical protein